jgi:hypothetical protein
LLVGTTGTMCLHWGKLTAEEVKYLDAVIELREENLF